MNYHINLTLYSTRPANNKRNNVKTSITNWMFNYAKDISYNTMWNWIPSYVKINVLKCFLGAMCMILQKSGSHGCEKNDFWRSFTPPIGGLPLDLYSRTSLITWRRVRLITPASLSLITPASLSLIPTCQLIAPSRKFLLFTWYNMFHTPWKSQLI
jgi:hypothetical protein